MNCRYLDDEGMCIPENKICDNCKPRINYGEYTYHYDVFKGVTVVKLLVKGRVYMSCEIYGQLSAAACRSYAQEMAKILIDKGVIK